MKRRCSRLNSEDPRQIPTSSQGSHRVLCSRFQAPTLTSLGNGIKEMSCHKRSRFEDLDVERTLIQRRDASSVPAELTQAPGKMSDIVEKSCKSMRPSLLVASATPVNTDTFVSPFQDAPKTLDVNMKNALKNSHWKQKDVKKHNHALGPDGTKSWHANIFNRKRQKLRQWVADTSLSEIDEICSKGCNIISVLLSRLIPESSKSKNDKEGIFGHVETDTKSALLASRGSDIRGVKFDWMLEREPCYRNAISSCQTNTLGAIIPSLDSTLGCARTDIPCREWVSDSEPLGGALSLYDDSDLNIISPVRRRYGHVAHNDELDFFCGEEANKSTLALYFDNPQDGRYCLPKTSYQGIEQKTYFRSSDLWMDDDELISSSDLQNNREPRSPFSFSRMPMLTWDFDNKKDERNLWITSRDIKADILSTSLVSPLGGLFSYPNRPNNKELENLLPLSCFSSHHYHEEPDNLLLLLHKAGHHKEFGEHVLEDKDDILPDSSHIPFTLSCIPNYFNQFEDCHDDAELGCGTSFFPNDDHSYIKKEYHQGSCLLL